MRFVPTLSRPRTLLVLAVFAITTMLLAPAVTALVVPDTSGPLAGKHFRHQDLYIGNIYQPSDQLTAGDAGERLQGLQALGVSPNLAHIDRRSGRFGTLIMSQPLIPGDGIGNNITWNQLGVSPTNLQEIEDAAWQALTGFLRTHQNTLALDPVEMTPSVQAVRDGGLVQIHAKRSIAGLPVRDSFLTAVINNGNLVLMGARNWGDVNLNVVPKLTTIDATAVMKEHLAPLTPNGAWGKPELFIIPMAEGRVLSQVPVGQGMDYRLVWAVRPLFDGASVTRYEALVDAHSGELLAFEDTTHYGSTRTVTGGVLPVSNDGAPPDGVEQANWPMPFADVTASGNTLFTTAGGELAQCVEGDITTTLTGPFLFMNDNCGAINETTSSQFLNLGTSPGTDCNVAPGASAGNTRSSRSAFYEIGRIQEMARGYLPNNSWLQTQLQANMNINNNCNATWSGQVNFFTSGGGCNNTGELAGVFDHEWGHGMDNNDPTGSVSNPGEGIADIYAAIRLNTSCIGRNFRATNCGGYGDPCTQCSGVRDIDWANRASGMPHDLADLDARCGTGGGTPCGGSTHCEGAAYAEAVWDLFNRDLQGGAFNWDLNTSLALASELTYYGAAPVGNWFQCVDGTGTGDGCNADGGYLNYLAADDDNGNLSDGTPHMSALFAAFDRHGIACATPTVADAGCAGGPTTAPVVAATAIDRGASLTWGAVTGASSYDIYRTDGIFGCDFGKTLVGTTTGTSFIDDGLANGREYNYMVIAIGPSDTCYSPASACSSVTPVAGPNLALDPTTISLAVSGGDGDEFLDNCEVATLNFDLANVGAGNATNVRIVDASSSSHPGIDIGTLFPVPVSNSLADCDLGTGHLSFTATGLSFGDSLVIDVEFTADEIAPLTKTATITINNVESDFTTVANQTFDFETDLDGWTVTSGTFDRNGSQGGGDSTSNALNSSNGLNGACDQATSPLLRFSAISTMTLWNNYDIEDISGGTWYDRANVALVDSNGGRTVVNPDGGRLYNAGPGGPGSYSGCNDPEEGWAATQSSWSTSTWSNAALGGGAIDGVLGSIQVTYGTDGALAQRGFAFDQVNVTNVDVQGADAQSDSCPLDVEVFTDGFEVGNTTNWTTQVP